MSKLYGMFQISVFCRRSCGDKNTTPKGDEWLEELLRRTDKSKIICFSPLRGGSINIRTNIGEC